jgi:hypothetical protein
MINKSKENPNVADGGKRQAIYFTGEEGVTLEGLEQQLTSTPLPSSGPAYSSDNQQYFPSLSSTNELSHYPLTSTNSLFYPSHGSFNTSDSQSPNTRGFVEDDTYTTHATSTPNITTASNPIADISDIPNSPTIATATPTVVSNIALTPTSVSSSIATTSVRDLKKAFDHFAGSSDVSLLDHVARNKVRSSNLGL